MEHPTVWNAMAEAYENASGQPLAERLVAALRAAEGEGGDIRGRQSAALLLVTGKPTGRPWEDRVMDLRVDDHAEPVEELARLVRLRRAYTALRGAGRATGRGVDEKARRHTLEALRLAPEEVQVRLYAGLMHARAGEWEAALPLLRSVVHEEPRWSEALRRMAAVDHLPADLLSEIESRLV
jgi:hypothetical protein